MPIINRDTDYAVRAMAHLGQAEDVVSVSDLAAQESVPEVFLRKIMQKLHRAGLVESAQGPFGGYKLRKGPGEVTIKEVLEAIQGPLKLNACFVDQTVCRNVRICALRRRLVALQGEIDGWLDGITLADLLESLPEKGTVKT